MITITPEELIRYLYNEASAKQVAEIEKALQEDWTLREKLSVLKASQERLNTIVEKPRTEVVLNILNYAREKSTEQVL